MLSKALKYFGVSLLVLLLAPEVQAQRPESFPEDSTGFFEAMDDYFRDARRKEGRQFMKEFEEIWFGGHFNEYERNKVIEVCNQMLEKRMLPFPEFRNYLYSVMRYKYSGKPEYIFKNWHKAIDQLLEESKRKYDKFLRFSADLFESNALYKTNQTTWQAGNPDFIIDYRDGQPVVLFPSLDLYCFAKKDTAIIHETEGKYFPMDGTWQGLNGKVTWKRAGFDPDKVYAELSDYEIDMRHPYYDADSVRFHNPQYFGDAVLTGSMEEKILANVTPESATYPRFASYNKRLRIKNLVKNVDYDGGFSQQGSKFLGTGTDENKAQLIFYREDSVFLKANATTFSIRTDRILTQRAEIVIYLDNDSIYHPGVKLQFLNNDRMLSLIRTGEDITKSPYYNTYHMVDMRFEVLHWKIDDPLITMEALFGSTDRTALFESLDYFKEKRYDDLYRLERVHPLVKVKRCTDQFEKKVLTVDECCQCMKMPPSDVKVMLLELSNYGYVSFNFDEEKVIVKEKLFKYILAKAGNVDYDILQFNSQPEKGYNAKLNLLNNEMSLAGIKSVLLSDSHLVYLYPKDEEIILGKNRDFEFNGILNAGNFEIFGQKNQFTYDEFKFDSPEIDSIRIYVNTGETDERGRPEFKRVKTVIEDVEGVLQIDAPNNKSGLKPLHRYPIFNSLDTSYAFYDKPSVQGGVYHRDNFGFQLDPFELDSLDNFRNDGVAFSGVFESAGIFPEFEEELKLQPDYSLGFVRSTPPEGYDIYDGKGKFFNDINLSAEGLRGDGYIEYLTSTTESKDIIFHPDSMFGDAGNFIIEEQMAEVQYPPVTGQDVFVKFYPKGDDHMIVRTKEQAMRFYDGESRFFGKINYSPEELRGSGKYEFKEAEMYSKDYLFQFSEFFSDTADFRLHSLEDNSLTFNTSNVNAHVDFQERKAEFVSNGGTTTITLPENQYMASMDRFTWYMDSEQIELSGGEVSEEAAKDGLSLEGSKFTSIHPDQDSLNFYSSAAKFNYTTKVIKADKVKLIGVGDAYIYPDSGRVVIREKAKMDPLEDARILANTTTEYHEIYEADLEINGRLNYEGSGKIDYVDKEKNAQIIKLDKIYLDTTYQTIAVGEIPKEQGFSLSKNYLYHGNVRLEAAKRLLNFSGYTKIFHTCSDLSLEWFQFKADIDPGEIYIPVDSIALSEGNDNLVSGIRQSSDPYSVYSTFISEPQKASDPNLFNATGFLYYDEPASTYIISNLQKINQRTLPGDYLELNKNNCAIGGEGKFSLGADLGRISNQPSGEITHYTIEDSLGMNLVWLLDFYFDKKAVKIMTETLQEMEGLARTDFDRPGFRKGVQEILGKEETDRIISELSLYQKYRKFPKGLEQTFFFNDLTFAWNDETESYQSTGKIGIGNIEDEEVNRFVEGKIEIVKRRSSDELHIYLEPDSKTWFYFNYRAEIMQAVSSIDEFNTAVEEAKKNKLDRKRGQAKYRYLLSSEAKKIQFIRKFENL